MAAYLLQRDSEGDDAIGPASAFQRADPFYGSRRITAQLRREGRTINRKAVQRHMREMGIVGIAPGPNLSRHDSEHCVYPYLLRDRTNAYPNHVWGIDITYVRLHAGWLYLVAVLDWFSRYVVSRELDQTLALPFVLTAAEQALAQARPVIWNSDQGSHFTSPQYLDLLTAACVQISMDGKGRALDNIFVERLWRTVKYEEVYLRDYTSPREARQGLRDYFLFYCVTTSCSIMRRDRIRRSGIGRPPRPISRRQPPDSRWSRGHCVRHEVHHAQTCIVAHTAYIGGTRP